ncbi:MAG TPA: hypothetical protein VIY66_08515 [Candidatus Acidoferrales bacterium]
MTSEDIARWMAEELERRGSLCQEDAVQDIAKKFGQDFTYENENGNPAIRRDVLAAFRRLTKDAIVWERGERLWRKRTKYDDAESRMQE